MSIEGITDDPDVVPPREDGGDGTPDVEDEHPWSGRLSDTSDPEEEQNPIQEGDPEEYMAFEVVPWARPTPTIVIVFPGVSVLNWYLYTGQGKVGFTYADDRTV